MYCRKAAHESEGEDRSKDSPDFRGRPVDPLRYASRAPALPDAHDTPGPGEGRG